MTKAVDQGVLLAFMRTEPGRGADRQAEPLPVSDRLDSWKEIATYLRREVRTVQLWEKQEQLPVHRHFHKNLGSVFAFRSEIDFWRQRVSRQKAAPAATGESKLAGEPLLDHAKRPMVTVLPLKVEGNEVEGSSSASTLGAEIFGRITNGVAANGSISVVFSQAGDSPDTVTQPRQADDRYTLRATGKYQGASFDLSVALMSEETGAEVFRNESCWTAHIPDAEIDSQVDQIVQCFWLKLACPVLVPPYVGRKQKSTSREAYLKGRYFWNQRNEAGMRKAVEYFNLAIEQDPDFALGYAGLADALNLLSFYEIEKPSEAMPAARRAALKAVDLEPNLAEAHASFADICFHFDRDWSMADREYRRAIECNPGYALSYHWYANLLAARGQHEAAHVAMLRALEIDPLSLSSLVWAGVTSYLARRNEDAVGYYRSALELNPQFIWAHMYLALSLEQLRDFDQAIGEFDTAILLSGGKDSIKAMKAHTLAISGNRDQARRMLAKLSSRDPHRQFPSYDMAAGYAALGDADQSVAWLDKAFAERNMRVFTVTQDPRFDPLRSLGEFRRIVGRIGLDPQGRV